MMEPNLLPPELEENDLAAFLANFGQFWKKYGNMILISVLLLGGGLFAIVQWDRIQREAHERAWSDLALATSPDIYAAVAREHDDPAVSALANLRGARLILQQVTVTRHADDAPDTEVDDASGLLLDQADAMYVAVADQPGLHRIFRLNALLGRATIAEETRQWPQAKALYEMILDEAGPGYEAIHAQAQAKLDLLDEIAKPVRFASQPTEAPDVTETTPNDPLGTMDAPPSISTTPPVTPTPPTTQPVDPTSTDDPSP